jgi:hypothetical protein
MRPRGDRTCEGRSRRAWLATVTAGLGCSSPGRSWVPVRSGSTSRSWTTTPSGFELEVGWNPLVVTANLEATREPATYQGISVWGHTPVGEDVIQRLRMVGQALRSVRTSEPTVPELRDPASVPAWPTRPLRQWGTRGPFLGGGRSWRESRMTDPQRHMAPRVGTALHIRHRDMFTGRIQDG